MEDWQKRVIHLRAVRDALVKCGNEPPKKPDPPWSLIQVKLRIFRGKIFWDFMEEKGHNQARFEECKCRGQFHG